MSQSQSNKPNQVEGEGSYSATHRYQRDVKRYQEQGNPERAAQRAKQAVEGEEGKELQKAEDEAKQRGKQIDRK
ncbi:MAG: hypothetical protein KC492_22765 [Myxococcales bacterium]|nr:hypothetical protein [Myxococcales bacterium]